MTKNKRLEKLEEMVRVKNYGLRAIMRPKGLYSSNPEAHLYWTDDPIKGMEALYGEPYREVQHPDGIRPTMQDLIS